MRYAVVIDTKAAREIEALPRQDQRRIISKIEALANNPRPSGCVRLAGESGLWRCRSGVYRIIYQIQDARLLIVVVKVGHRRDVYRGI
ncbi:MAG: type II toxin-antitoxin system RelE/ParE family toxin [Planctomycetes bacterium]|nr:type II toxin-antitoxin system RelE/ParE family toxin [Planctomycetota bacterium]